MICLASFVAERIAPLRPRSPSEPSAQLDSEPFLSDNEVLSRVCVNPADAALYGGDLSGHASHSEADLALVNALALVCRNRAQAERIWLASGLGQRDKTQRRADYRKRTLDAAFNFSEPLPVDLSGVTCKGEPLSWGQNFTMPDDKPSRSSSEYSANSRYADAGMWGDEEPKQRLWVGEDLFPLGSGPIDLRGAI